MTRSVPPPPLFYGFGFAHHGARVAFHGLAHALDRETVIDITPRFLPHLPHRLQEPVNWRWRRLNEWRLKPFFRRDDGRVIHYFFPENTMFQAAKWKGTHPLSATCHQPVENFRRRADDPRLSGLLASLRACDALVVQCASDAEAYRDFLGVPRVDFIPLGVDTDYFCPDKHPRTTDSPGLLTVGSWLRDYATWAATTKIVHARRPDVTFTVVASPDTLTQARTHLADNRIPVRWLTGISDEALREEYLRCQLFHLPLEHAMANDALLEALAIGCPIIVTDLPATRDYVPDSAGIFVPRHEAEAGAEAILRLLDHSDAATAMGRRAREHAVTSLDWRVIAQRYRDLWNELGS